MKQDPRALSDAVLQEGYLLYPYTRSALKNRHRHPFGTLYPESFCRARGEGDAWLARLEHVLIGDASSRLLVEARFLEVSESEGDVRSVALPAVTLHALSGAPARASCERGTLSSELVITARAVEGRLWKISVELRNATRFDGADQATREEALRFALASAHLLIRLEGGELVSAIDPPAEARALVEACRSSGLWPVLLGAPGTRDMLLAAPIILYDYPQLAPESPGDFFDATEIDELLTLRVLTLTDEEKRTIAAEDPRARELLARTETLGLPQLGALHGRVVVSPRLRPGARVRLRPNGRADVFDLALDGRLATVAAIERDLEGHTYVVVSVDDDPGRDLGAYAHRFFFRPEEVEVL